MKLSLTLKLEISVHNSKCQALKIQLFLLNYDLAFVNFEKNVWKTILVLKQKARNDNSFT
jgi:hypothetical protein